MLRPRPTRSESRQRIMRRSSMSCIKNSYAGSMARPTIAYVELHPGFYLSTITVQRPALI